MKKLILFAIIPIFTFTFTAKSQILNPVSWSYAAKKMTGTKVTVFLKATIDEGWHLYSQHINDSGPVKTTITFIPSTDYSIEGKTLEPQSISKYEPAFSMNVAFFEKSVVFKQQISLKTKKTIIKGKISFMVCNNKQCLPPSEVNFSIPVNNLQ